MKKLKSLMGIAILGLLSAISYAENNKDKTLMEKVKTTTYDIMDKETVTLDFDTNSSVVSEGMKTSIRALVDAAKKEGRITKVFVASWADRSLPMDSSEKLSDGDKNLAKDRADNVKKVLASIGMKDVEIYNMAEQPSWLGRTFRTDDAQVKQSMKGKSVNDHEMTELGRKLDDKGGVGKVVVAVVRRGATNAM